MLNKDKADLGPRNAFIIIQLSEDSYICQIKLFTTENLFTDLTCSCFSINFRGTNFIYVSVIQILLASVLHYLKFYDLIHMDYATFYLSYIIHDTTFKQHLKQEYRPYQHVSLLLELVVFIQQFVCPCKYKGLASKDLTCFESDKLMYPIFLYSILN